MARTLLAVLLAAVLSACAGHRQAPAPSQPAPAPEVAAPLPAPDPELPAEPEGDGAMELSFEIQLPSGDWRRVPDEMVTDQAQAVFVNDAEGKIIQIYLHRQSGSNAHKVAQIRALGLVMQGVQPLDLVPDENADHAYLTAIGDSTRGKLVAYFDIRPSSFDPDVYVIVMIMWFAEGVTPEDIAQYRKVSDSVKLEPR